MSLDVYSEDRPPRRRWRRLALLAVLGLVLGLPAGYGVGKLMKAARSFHPPSWSDELSLSIAAMLLIGGIALLIASLSRSGAAYMADPHEQEPGRPVRPAQVAYFRLQGGVMALAGAMMATPVLGPLLDPAGFGALAPLAFGAIVASFVLQTVLNLMVWRRSDELIRRAIADAGAVCFWLLQGALFLWAAAEKLGLAPPLHNWDALTVLMAVYLIMSVVVGYRRGLG